MNYFIDTEFLEGKQDKTILGFKYGETKSTIDLISIGIISEDNREYYAISKDFNLKQAWNRFNTDYENGCKNYWIRDNVLKSIWLELSDKEYNKNSQYDNHKPIYNEKQFTYFNLKKLIKMHGKTNKKISKEILSFVTPEWYWSDGLGELPSNRLADNPIKFYGYYCDYDWVVFCWLFGNMINLPKGFPMYCNDLKQTLNEKMEGEYYRIKDTNLIHEDIKKHKNYPKQTNEHNALDDAKWNKGLYKFLQKNKWLRK